MPSRRSPDRCWEAAPWSPSLPAEAAPDLLHRRARRRLGLGRSRTVPYPVETIMATRSATARQSATSAQSNPTLRFLLDTRRSEGRRMSLEGAVAVLVPVCMDLHERHARGERAYVHPSSIAPGADGLARLQPAIAVVPTVPSDRVCLAPELQRT